MLEDGSHQEKVIFKDDIKMSNVIERMLLFFLSKKKIFFTSFFWSPTFTCLLSGLTGFDVSFFNGSV